MTGYFGTPGNDTYHGDDEGDYVNTLEGDDIVYTYGGHDYVVDRFGNNKIYLGDGNDTVLAGHGRDWLSGGDGDDEISDDGAGFLGYQHMFGGAGNDTLTIKGGGETYMYGGSGDDTYVVWRAGDINEIQWGVPDADINEDADDGYDTIKLSTGWANFHMADNVEALIASNANAEIDRIDIFGNIDDSVLGVEVFGNASNNHITGSIVRDILHGGAGNDTLDGHYGIGDVLRGEAGDDTLILGGGSGAKLYGGTGNDTYIVNSPYGDRLDSVVENAGEGVDTLVVNSGTRDLNRANLRNIENLRINDTGLDGTLTGNNHHNIIDAGSGDETIYGRLGNDRLSGNLGDDQLFGDEGDDVLNGGGGGDYLSGGTGNDTIDGLADNDTLDGGTGQDRMWGGGGDDLVRGGADADTIFGNLGNDRLYGDAGDDEIYGDAGDDVLFGGLGRDRIEGGAGADRIVYNSIAESTRAAPDKLVAFETAFDRIDLSAIDANTTLAGNQAFNFVGNARPFFTSAGDLWVESNGVAAKLFGDLQGDGVADFQINVFGTTELAPVNFVL